MITLIEASRQQISSMADSYFKAMCAPMDDMWENAIIPKGNSYLIMEDEHVGYLIVDEKNTLLQFYILEGFAHRSDEFFSFALNKLGVDKAIAGTYEPMYFSLCMDRAKSTQINSYVFRQGIEIRLDSPLDNLDMSIAEENELEEIINYHEDKADIHGEFMRGYLINLIGFKGLYIFRKDGEIIGTGEFRPDRNHADYSHIGMTVSTEYRNIGLGSYILNQMRKAANERGFISGCSTDLENTASKKAIKKCGFVSYHRILDIHFNTAE